MRRRRGAKVSRAWREEGGEREREVRMEIEMVRNGL